MIVHLGIDLCCANDLGVCSGRQDKRSTIDT